MVLWFPQLIYLLNGKQSKLFMKLNTLKKTTALTVFRHEGATCDQTNKQLAMWQINSYFTETAFYVSFEEI